MAASKQPEPEPEPPAPASEDAEQPEQESVPEMPASKPEPDPEQRRRRRTTVNALTLASVVRNIAINIRNLSEQEIWNDAYSGDFGAQAQAQGLLESASSVFSFVLNPILGGVSDSVGRKPLMNMAPCVSVVSCTIMGLRPGVPALVMRRFCSPLSNTPWHSGESACLADLFQGDPAGYGLARSRINSMSSATKIVGPVIGAWLAAKHSSLPWFLSAFGFAVMATVIRVYLRETLETKKRVKFKWKRSTNPLRFLTLFRGSNKLRVLVIAHLWSQAFTGRRSTSRYENLHLTQQFGWGIAERAKYSSFRGLFDVPASHLSGTIMQRLGVEQALLVGNATNILEQILFGCARQGWHYYAIRPLRVTADVAELAMQYITTNIGAAEGIPQGELQAALSSLSTVIRIITPIIWGRLYAYGVSIGMPQLFYFVSAGAGVVQVILLRVLCALVRRDQK